MFKKGDKVTRVLIWFDWNGTRNGVSHSITELTVESWGKKQATATHLENGVFTQNRIYVDSVNKGGNWFFRAGEGFDLPAMLAQYTADQITFLRTHRLDNEHYHRPAILKQIARLEGVTQ